MKFLKIIGFSVVVLLLSACGGGDNNATTTITEESSILGTQESSTGYTRDSAKQTVTDNTTKLMWQDNQDAKTVKKSWENAKSYCEGLMLGDFGDWRLPNLDELETIADTSRRDPSIDPVFENTISGKYWSSSTIDSVANAAWSILFYYGATNPSNQSDSNNIRCVRGATTNSSSVTLSETGVVGVWNTSTKNDEDYMIVKSDGSVVDYDYDGDSNGGGRDCYHKKSLTIENLKDDSFRFDSDDDIVAKIILSGDKATVTAGGETATWTKSSLQESDFSPLCSDTTTELIWQDSKTVVKKNWQDAKNYCETFVHKGFSNWKLPNLQALQTLADTQPAVFIINSPESYWSSTVHEEFKTMAWFVNLDTNIALYQPMFVDLKVRCFRP